MDVRFSSQVDGILKHAAPRAQAKRWARNLRFLTFDDGKSPGALPPRPVSGQCRRCAERAPVPSGHMCATHANVVLTPEKLQDWERKLKSYRNPCVHVEDLTCHGCRDIPLFPNTGDVSTFRIRRVPVDNGGGKYGSCNHFVAVSYCWDSQDPDNQLPPYTVTEEDGTKRAMRAPRATIDRVVRFAMENGFRMIWIDQECIEQDNPKEKELAIQCMDVVYQRAHICIGLMSTRWEQRHLDALLLGSEFDHMGRFKGGSQAGRRGPPPIRPKYFFASGEESYYEDLVEAVCLLLADRWNTRAWIFQEALVAADKMLLLFPIVSTISTKGWWQICHEKSLSELAVSIVFMQTILEEHITPTFDDEMRESPLFEAIRFFYPRALDDSGILGFSEFHNRRRCDAATGLSFLNRRELFRDMDRVAILANLCGYELRLDTAGLEDDGYDLFDCVLTLALINGDMSLLPPEMYKVPEDDRIIYPFGGKLSDFSWAHIMPKGSQFVGSATMTPTSNTTIADDHRQYHLSSSGLSLLGTLWQVKEFIALETIKTKHFSRWQEAKKCETSMDVKRKAVAQILFEVIMLLRVKGEIQVADAILNSTSDPKFRQKAPLRANAEPKKGFMNGLFSRKTRTDSQTISAASKERRDNIFQSNSMVESVLEMPRDMTEPPENMFWLSWTLTGNRMAHQSWIVDRVMDTGGLWVAHPVDKWNAEIPFGTDKRAPETTSQGSRARDGAAASLSERWQMLEWDTSSDWRAVSRFIRESGPTFFEQSHATKLKLVSVYAKFIDHVNGLLLGREEGESEAGTATAGPRRDSAMQYWAAHLIKQVDASEFMNRRAVFDVGGDATEGTLVLTPFQAQLESIPRPQTRALSVSWVVEQDHSVGETAGSQEDGRMFRTRDMVKGMWRYTFFHSGRFTLI